MSDQTRRDVLKGVAATVAAAAFVPAVPAAARAGAVRADLNQAKLLINGHVVDGLPDRRPDYTHTVTLDMRFGWKVDDIDLDRDAGVLTVRIRHWWENESGARGNESVDTYRFELNDEGHLPD